MNAQRVILLMGLAAAAGCGDSEAATRVPLNGQQASEGRLEPALQMPIDSGNVAYRAGDYAGALRHYRVATDRAPNNVTGWIGISMAAAALRNQPLLDSANARIGVLAPDLRPGSAHTGADSAAAGAKPADHP